MSDEWAVGRTPALQAPGLTNWPRYPALAPTRNTQTEVARLLVFEDEDHAGAFCLLHSVPLLPPPDEQPDPTSAAAGGTSSPLPSPGTPSVSRVGWYVHPKGGPVVVPEARSLEKLKEITAVLQRPQHALVFGSLVTCVDGPLPLCGITPETEA